MKLNRFYIITLQFRIKYYQIKNVILKLMLKSYIQKIKYLFQELFGVAFN